MKKQSLLLILVLFTYLNTLSQQYNKISERTKKRIDSTYTALIKKHNVIGLSLAIVDNGEIVYSNGYGFADREKKIAATDKTIYRIWSCTKSFTSLSLLQLQEKGKLNINHSIKEYIPELKITSRFNDNNQFFINDMMCHVSGLPSDIWNGSMCDTPSTIRWKVEQLNKQTAISPRLYTQAYSNEAYNLLGEVVGRQGKTTFGNYLKENVFLPLEMNSSFMAFEERFEINTSKAYCKNKEFREPWHGETGAGGILSTATDMANYLLMFLNNGSYNGKQIITSSSLEAMKTNQLEDVLLKSTKQYGYGLGIDKTWAKVGTDSTTVRLIGHDGGGFAFRSVFRFIPELNVGIVILTNTDNGEFIWYEHPLLDIYLKETKSEIINYNYIGEKENNGTRLEIPANDSEIEGQFNTGEALIKVRNADKVSINSGLMKVLLKRKEHGLTIYSMKISLFGIIPIKKLPTEIEMVKLNGEVYAKQIDTQTNREVFIAVKTKPVAIPQSWKEKFGEYVITGRVYKCTDCPDLVFEGTTIKLYESNGFIAMKKKHKISDMNETLYLNVVSDTLVVTGGLGRNSGETVKILENGNIYYSGFEFTKKK